jgi:hypothetical protein
VKYFLIQRLRRGFSTSNTIQSWEELVLSDDDDNDEDDDGGIIDSNNQMQVHNTYMIIRNIF